jgi:hypothetical protein
MPASAIQTHASALELMKYTVKTIYGVSNKKYSGAVWLTLAVLLLHTFDKVVPERMSFSGVPIVKVYHTTLSSPGFQL